jgi:YspA, cpYpsA-related SLOG family
MRILIVGDRHWNCADLAEQIVSRLLARYGPNLTIVHGGEPGVDQAVAMACRELGVAVEPRLAPWHQTGLPTIATKNRELIKAAPDLCVAVHQTIGDSKRTRDCVLQAVQAGITTYLIENERAIPSRLKARDKRLE